MFLTEANVLHYLLERRFADLESVVDGEFHVRDLSRRNRNFRVTCGAREYLVKQPRKWDRASRRTLEQEASVYWHVKTDAGFRPLKRLLPESYAYDPANSVLILEYLAEQSSLRASEDRFAPKVARLAGGAMGAFHRDMRGLADSAMFPRRKPWYLGMHRAETGERKKEEEGQRQLLLAVRKHGEFGRALDLLSEEWREETAIHGDWKLENCLLAAGERLQVIDWELSSWGDPFEDIGTMLQSYWSFWVRWPSQFRIEEIRPALRAFLEGYAAEEGGEAVEMAPRALRFAAGRMLQTASEVLDKAERLSAEAVCLLQASLNMLTRPQWAVAEMFGADWS